METLDSQFVIVDTGGGLKLVALLLTKSVTVVMWSAQMARVQAAKMIALADQIDGVGAGGKPPKQN